MVKHRLLAGAAAIGLLPLAACSSNGTPPETSSGTTATGSQSGLGGSTGTSQTGTTAASGAAQAGSTTGSGVTTGSASGSASGTSGSSNGTTGSASGNTTTSGSASGTSGNIDSGMGTTGGGEGGTGGSADATVEGSACGTDLGHAMEFQSQKPDLLQATIAKLPTGNAARTIELWAYFDGTGNSWLNEHGLFETGDRNAGAPGGCHEFALNSTAVTGQLAMLHPYGNCNAVDNFFNVPATALTADKGWLHISLAYDDMAKNFQFTINGDGMLANGTGNGAAGRTHPESSWPPGTWGTTSYTPADAANFGQNNPGGNLLSIGTTVQFAGPTGWGGRIDELRVWSTFRDAATIKANMYTLMRGNEPGLIAYYKFDEGSGLTVADSTGDRANDAHMTPWNGANPPLMPPTWVKSDIPGPFTCNP
jgi:hypothetical protein